MLDPPAAGGENSYPLWALEGIIVTGSVAGIVYGEPRVTHDVDLVIDILPNQVESFLAAFPLEEFYAASPHGTLTGQRLEERSACFYALFSSLRA